MHYIRPSAERGHVQLDWLDSYHSFSFGHYHDPNHRGFSDLRVINQDIIAPGGGFPTHAHADMEIITYVLRGQLAHKDSLGTVATISAGEVQRMSAGSGIEHSEYNASKTEPVELLQIWILPEHRGIVAGYEQKNIGITNSKSPLQVIVQKGGGEETLNINQQITLYRGILNAAESTTYTLLPNRAVWVQIISGKIVVDGISLNQGDALGLTNIHSALIAAETASEFLLFDLRS